jgi:hypothetical protein
MTGVNFQQVIELSYRDWFLSSRNHAEKNHGGERARRIKNYYFPAFVFKNAET